MPIRLDSAPPAPAVGADMNAAPPPPREERRHSLLGDLREIAVTEIWGYRELVHQFTLRDIRIRYKQAVMGFAWAILMPALIVAAGTLVRFAIAYVGGDSVETNDVARMAVKALPWAFFVGAIGFATSSLISNTALVQKIYFPREVLPLSSTLAQGFDTMIGAVVLLLALPLLGVWPTTSWVWVPLLALLLFTFTVGVALLLGCANLFFRDVKYIVQVLLTFGIFFTPVFFEPQMFGATGAQVMMLNPLAPILEGMRLAIVDGHHLHNSLIMVDAQAREVVVWSPWYLAYAGGLAFVALIGGALIFHRAEFIFAEYV
jgi:lipopolysaccharide transport system permease protein